MFDNGFQMVTAKFEPGSCESPMIIKETDIDGKVLNHNFGLTLSTELVAQTLMTTM